MFCAFIILIAVSFTVQHVTATEQETVRTARQFRNIPNGVVSSTYPFYNLLNVNGPGTYAFGYEVIDPRSGNVQFKDEEKFHDGTVKGSYGVLQPNNEIHITKYIADHKGYRSVIEKRQSPLLPTLSELPLAFGSWNPPPLVTPTPFVISQPFGIPGLPNNQPNAPILTDRFTPVHYTVGSPNTLSDATVNEPSSQNGILGWFENVQQQLFKPIQGFFTPQNQNQGPLSGWFSNLPFLNQNNNNQNAPTIEQFPPGAANDIYNDVPIVRPVAVNTQPGIQAVPVPVGIPVHSGNIPSTYSNLLRLPIAYSDSLGAAPIGQHHRRGWLSNLMGRRRLHQDLNRQINESNDNNNKDLVLITPATVAAK